MSTTAPKKRKRLTLPKVRDPRRFVVVGPELPKWPPGPPTDPAIPHDPTVQAKRYAVPNPHPSLSSKEECRIFISLYSAHREFVRRTVERHGVPIRDSDDITQEVFAIALQRIKDFDAARAARPWLFVIAIQRAANYRRLARNRREPLSPTPPPDPPSEAIDSESALLASEARSIVRDLIGRLSPKLRAILVMHDLEERPIDEIAKELNIPLKTAQARLKLARDEVLRRGQAFALSSATPLYNRDLLCVREELLSYRKTPVPWKNLPPEQLRLGPSAPLNYIVFA